MSCKNVAINIWNSVLNRTINNDVEGKAEEILQEVWQWFYCPSMEFGEAELNKPENKNIDDKYLQRIQKYLLRHFNINISHEPYTLIQYYNAFSELLNENGVIPYFG